MKRTSALLVPWFTLLAACGGHVSTLDNPEPEAPFAYATQGPVEQAFCRAVERCTDYGWIHRNATTTCGAGDAFDVALSRQAGAELAAQVERDLCRAYAPPALVRHWCGDLPADEQLACIRPLCPVDAVGVERCLHDGQPPTGT